MEIAGQISGHATLLLSREPCLVPVGWLHMVQEISSICKASVISIHRLLRRSSRTDRSAFFTIVAMTQDITPVAKPIYDDKIDGKEDEKEDITVAPAELSFGHHLDSSEEAHVKQ